MLNRATTDRLEGAMQWNGPAAWLGNRLWGRQVPVESVKASARGGGVAWPAILNAARYLRVEVVVIGTEAPLACWQLPGQGFPPGRLASTDAPEGESYWHSNRNPQNRRGLVGFLCQPLPESGLSPGRAPGAEGVEP
ncbi:MAG: hypothetical protein H6809_04915 [Phycisphaeraceae bacterium]|nr:hypothetical protein [Phycisphaeraceae bacterium]